MLNHNPPDDDFETRVRASYDRQQLLKTIGATLMKISPGEVRIELPFNPALTQQHGFMHAGIITALVDTACGYAAATLMPARSEVLTVEYKINFLAPAIGENFVGIGRVIKPGRTLTICAGEVAAYDHDAINTVAVMQATMMTMMR